MSTIMLKDFEKRWGVGGEPVFNEIVVRGFMNRQLGVHPCFVIAMCLDPRFKHQKKCYRSDLPSYLSYIRMSHRTYVWSIIHTYGL